MDQCNYRNSDSWSWLSVSGGPIYHLVVRKIISGLHTRSVLSYTKLEEKTGNMIPCCFCSQGQQQLTTSEPQAGAQAEGDENAGRRGAPQPAEPDGPGRHIFNHE